MFSYILVYGSVCVITIILCLRKNITRALGFFFFSLGVDFWNMRGVLGFEMPVSSIILLVIFVYVSFSIKVEISSRNIIKIRNLLMFLLIIGIATSFYLEDSDLNYSYALELSGLSLGLETVKNSSYLLLSIMLVVIFYRLSKSKIDVTRVFFEVVPLTIFVNFLSIIFLIGNFNFFRPLYSAVQNVEGVERYSGTFTDYELITDYCLIVFALSLVNYNRTKGTLYIVTSVLACIVGLYSGTRSFIFIVVIFFVLNVLLSNNRERIKRILFIGILLAFTPVLSEFGLFNLAIFDRLNGALHLVQIGEYEGASNRDYENLPRILENVEILGIGSLDFRAYGYSNLPGHFFYLNVILRYGIFGLFYIYLFFIKPIVVLSTNNFNNSYLRNVLFSLVIALFIQQFKINYLRDLNIIFLYYLITLIIYYIYDESRKTRLGNLHSVFQ